MLQNYLKRKQSSADGAVKSFIFILPLRLFKPRTFKLPTCVRQSARKPVLRKFRAFKYNRECLRNISCSDKKRNDEIFLRYPPKMMFFSRLPTVKKTSFLVGISNKFWHFLFRYGFSNCLKQLQTESQILCCTGFLADCRTKVHSCANQKFSTLVPNNKKGPTQSEKCAFFVKCSGKHNSQLDNFYK